jgi:argininosuccinate lyase
MELAASSQYSTATDLADWLVQNLNIPFRTAHEITGRIVKICVDENITLEQIGIEKLKKIDKRINKEIYKALNVRDSVERKISEGGTSPKNVLKQASRWIKRLENDK